MREYSRDGRRPGAQTNRATSSAGRKNSHAADIMRATLGDAKILDRKTPQNPKFANIGPTLDTGMNMRKILEKYEGTSGPNAHRRKLDEFYVRLKPATLGRLLEPVVSSTESVYGLGKEDARSVVSSVMPGADTGGPSESNILILDVRSFEDFQQCHCYSAQYYDVTNLNKASNNFPRELYFYRGPVECDKMIVIYDEDGKSASAIGNSFVEKGIENTYVVSGGFLGLCAACPSVLEGDVPDERTLADKIARAGLKLGSTSGSTTAGSVRGSTAGSVAGSVAGSARSRLSVAGGAGPRPPPFARR